MRKGLLASIALSLILGVGVFMAMGHIPTAQAAPAASSNIHFHFKGLAAEAGFYRVGDNNIDTFAYVFTDKSTARSAPGRPPAGSEVYVEVVKYDTTNYATLLDVFGIATPAPISFGNQLSSATLGTVVVTGSDYISGDTFTITLNGAWTGFGGLSRDVYNFHHSEPGFRVNGHSNGTFRQANATGNITVTAQDGSVVVTFNNAAAEYADLMSAKSGEVDIYHK